MNVPQRRENRRTHLDASVVPVERALLARAGVLEQHVAEITARLDKGAALPEFAEDKLTLAAEFRALAEDLHWW